MTIHQLLPARAPIELDQLLARLRAAGAERRLTPFAEPIKQLCRVLSRGLLSAPEVRQHPQLVALGYWLRPAALKTLEERFRAGVPAGTIAVPRGLAFHLPPANVDTLFVYSWLLSLCVGNANLIRLPEEPTPPVALLLGQIGRALEAAGLDGHDMIVTYPRDDRITGALSELVDVRCVWGGDAKVRHIHALPLSPHGIEIGFADRFSMAALRSQAVLDLDPEQRHALVEKFYNDVFWFDQMGCASPRIVFWVGSPELGRMASYSFFKALKEIIEKKGYRVELGTVLGRLGYAYRSILDLPVSRLELHRNELYVLTLDQAVDFRETVFGAGTLMQVALDRLADLVGFVVRKDQTLTQFGFASDELEALVRTLNGRGLDRIVPVGRALDFHHVWDGMDLLRQFSRLVHVER
jgi:hypothetical protein